MQKTKEKIEQNCAQAAMKKKEEDGANTNKCNK
jgi:hypothetical protein